MPSSDSDGDESQGSQEGWQENPEMNEAVWGTVLDPRAKKEPECSSRDGAAGFGALDPLQGQESLEGGASVGDLVLLVPYSVASDTHQKPGKHVSNSDFPSSEVSEQNDSGAPERCFHPLTLQSSKLIKPCSGQGRP